MEKAGRNDPCPCGSGKKFKKCCEAKVKHKKFHAEILSPSNASLLNRAQAVTGFFKKSVEKTLPPEHTPPPAQEKNPVM